MAPKRNPAGTTRFVDFPRSDGFGERELGVLDHHPAENRDEENSQHPADDHDRRRFEIVTPRCELGPEACNEKRGQRENRPRCDRFTDRTHRTGEVLFENRALEHAEQRHPDHGRRIRRRNRHTRLQAEVRVRRPKDHAHHQPDEQRPERKLPHLGVGGHVRLVL
jgi:hypothetical protein